MYKLTVCQGSAYTQTHIHIHIHTYTYTYTHTYTYTYAHMYQPLPAFTTLTDDFRGTLDHIFISAHMTPYAHLEMFSEETIFEEKSLPSSRYPSDHMACMALFSLDTV